MNSLERIRAAVAFEEPDRVPVVAQVFGHAGVMAGVPVDDYVRDGELLARCQIKALERYGYDAVFTVMDMNVENEALGARLRYRRNIYPVVEQPVINKNKVWEGCPLPDPEHAGRMPEMLKALRILRRKLGEEFLIVGCVAGPLTLAAQLLGAEETLYLAIDDVEQLGTLLDLATEVIIRFGLAQIEAGAHLPLVFDPFASPAVIPHHFFREVELPRLKRVFEAFKQAGALANWLHIAGPAQSILSFYPQARVDIADFDYYIPPMKAQNLLPHTCLNGNIKSLSFVEDSPEEIRSEASLLIRSFADRRGFILSSGCEIPPESKGKNIEALVRASRGRS
jgi:uroporphyrinogen decarboxylase